MTLRSSCDSVKTPMEFDRCSHAIFHFFSKYLKTFNYKIKKIQAGGRMLDIIGFQVMLRQTGNYNKYSYMTNTTYRSQLEILSICKYTINNISNSITSIRTCLVNTDIADHITSILHSNGMNTRDR